MWRKRKCRTYTDELYELEREELKRIVRSIGHEWNLKGILGNEGNITDIHKVRKALFIYLKNTK